MNTSRFFSSLDTLISQGRISHIISVLRNKCTAELPEHPLMANVIAGLDRLAETYSHLRQYLLEGKPDPGRDEIYDEIVENIYFYARYYLFVSNENRLDPFFGEFRLQKVRNRSVADIAADIDKTLYRESMAEITEADTLQFRRKREELLSSLFFKIWSLPPWDFQANKDIKAIIANEAVSFDIKSQVVSAMLLGLLKFYEPNRFLLLLDLYAQEEDERLAARMLTAIVLILSRHQNLVLTNPEVRRSLENLADSILSYSRLRDVVMTFIRTRDTDRVSREVSDLFNSTMKDLSPEMLEKLRNEGMAVDASDLEMNPEWEKLFKNKELEEKMQHINDMQLEGMDVMMQTFSRLKSFPFFNSLPNWFIPFSTSSTAVAELFEDMDSDAFMAMVEATDMCAADRYSFALGILQMPSDRRAALSTHLSGQLDALKEMMADNENVKKKPLFATEALVFARDLYRFAKLYPKKKDFPDPFEEPVDFLALPVLGSLLSESEIILAAADFYFEHQYYNLALPLYESVISSGNGNRHLFEKTGFCYQMLSDFSSALKNYEKADLFSSDVEKASSWLLKKLAFVSKALGLFEDAAGYYRRLLERTPDDLNVQYRLGNALLNAGEIEEGASLLAKVNYLDPSNPHYARACVRALVRKEENGDFSSAYSRILSLLDNDPDNLQNLRLAGHVAFLTNRYSEAADFYRRALGASEPVDFRNEVIAELNTLAPFDRRTLRIILDEVAQ